MTQQFFKGLLMALIGAAVAVLSTSPIVWPFVAVTLISTVLIYAGKNAFTSLQSDSPAGTLSWLNALSALLVLIGTGIVDSFAMYFIADKIDWIVLMRLLLFFILIIAAENGRYPVVGSILFSSARSLHSALADCTIGHGTDSRSGSSLPSIMISLIATECPSFLAARPDICS